MTNPMPLTEERSVPAPKVLKPSKERKAYNLDQVVEFLVQEARVDDAALEDAIAMVVTGIADKTIEATVGHDLMVVLVAAFQSNDHILDVLTLLYESGIEVALREVERVQAKRRKPAHGVKK